MIHALVLALSAAGFGALALGTRRQERDLFGGSLRRPATLGYRIAGAAALLLALGVLVTARGWSFGLVQFSGHTTLAAAIVYVALIARARRAIRGR